MTKKELGAFRDLLGVRRAELLGSARKTREEEMVLDSDDLPDEMDLASSEHNQSLVFRLRGREKILLKKIDNALLRIEDGTYGECESCGAAISTKRLQARPVTTLCISCKEEQERDEKAFN